MVGIYGIFRRSDDKCMYVGQSRNIHHRIISHLNGHTKNSFNKDEYYGEMIEQHFINDKAFRLERETYWIEQLQPKLNIVRDETNRGEYFKGEQNGMYGKHHSEESKEKNRQKHLGKQSGMKNKHHSEESKEKNRQSHLGEKNTMFGRHHSEESKKKISAYVQGTKFINNGVINKRVKNEKLDKYIQDGWKLGRLPWQRNL